jgi:hypothetical protein
MKSMITVNIKDGTKRIMVMAAEMDMAMEKVAVTVNIF